MKTFILMLFAVAAGAQTYVTVNGPITSASGGGWDGTIVYSHPAWSCGGTSVGAESITIRVRGGIFSHQFLAGCPGPYQITYAGSSTGKAYWTIPASKAPSTTIREIQSDYVPTPYWQISDAMLAVAPGGAGMCRGTVDGVSWAWLPCGGSGGGGGTWGTIIGNIATQLDLKTALDGKAALIHSHTINEVATLAAELAAREPLIAGGTSAQVWLGTKSWATLDTSIVPEGSRLYFTASRVTAVTDPLYEGKLSAGGSGWLRYDKTWTSPTKGDVGLGLVDNTPDASKPVSTAQAAEHALKMDKAANLADVANAGSARTNIGAGNLNSSGTPAAGALFRFPTTSGTAGAPAQAVEDDSGNLIAAAEVRSGGSGPGEAELPAGTGTNTGGWRGPAAYSASYYVRLPADPPASVGDVMRVKTISGSDIDAEWGAAAAGGGTTTGLYSGSLTFGTICDGCAKALTFAATGLATGRTLSLAPPSGLPAGLLATAYASAADTLTVRLLNMSGASQTLSAATYSVRDTTALGYIPGSGTIDFGSIADGACASNTFSLAGAAAGDNISEAWPSTFALTGRMYVSAVNTVTVRVCNFTGAANDPASATYGAAISR